MARHHRDVSRDEQWAKLVQAFAFLRTLGLIVKANFMCCGGCASAAIAEQFGKAVTKYNTYGKGPRPAVGSVFFTRQGRESAQSSGHLYLSYGQIEHYEGGEVKARSAWDTAMVGNAVVKALTDVGLMWWWSGDAAETIVVNVGEDAAERRKREQDHAELEAWGKLRNAHTEALGRLNELCALGGDFYRGEDFVARLVLGKAALARIEAAIAAITCGVTTTTTANNDARAEA